MFKEHLHREFKTSEFKKRRSSIYGSELRSTTYVESILVCTGVYNPESDLIYHLNNIFNDNNNNVEVPDENNNNDCENLNEKKCFYINSSNSSSTHLLRKNESMCSLNEIEKNELKNAMSRRNSFIDYFGNPYNTPDLTVDNFLDAVNHIIRHKVLDQI
jgi:hypothetical protein